MAKSLFAVYQDDALAPLSSRTAAHRATSSSTTKRKGVSTSSVAPGKENVDPFSTTSSKARLLAPSCGPKKEKPVSKASSKATLGSITKLEPGSSLGICTGTLRTRVLPSAAFDLPPLPSTSRGSKPSSKVPPPRLFRTAELKRDILVLEDEGALSSAPPSPFSAVDSGYARSDDGATDSMDDVLDRGRQTFEDSGEESDEVLNRRARALTESPLAEVTEAFTGSGAFRRSPPRSPSKASSSRTRPYPPPMSRNASADGLSKAVSSLRV